MTGWLNPARRQPANQEAAGWPRLAGRLLFICMLLLGAAAAWLVLTRPVHRIEGDFLEREDQRITDAWLREQLEHPVAEIRARAHIALARIQGREALDALVQSAADPAPSVRAAAAFALGNILDIRARSEAPPEPAIDALLGLLEDDERLVATRAVAALGKIKREQAAERITRTAAPIATIMTALIRMEADDQADFVAEYLDSDDQDSRWAAALAAASLRLVRRPRIWERLRPLASDDNDFVRGAALRAVSAGDADPRLLDEIRASVEHPDPKVRYEASRALAVFDGSAPADPYPAVEPALATRQLPAPDRALLGSGDYQIVAKTLGARLTLLTSIGDFEIELDYDQAPLTSEHFRRLAKRGALDASVFAAVQPNGYAIAIARMDPIRSELNPKPFLRGSLGLLRQGQASGGAFFLCLTALPLADGRYVNFGRLVSGDQLLDKIVAGTAVRAVRPAP